RNRDVGGDVRAEAAVIHVAAVRPRGRRRDRLAEVGRDAEAADHRLELHLAELTQAGRRILEDGGSALEVERPPDVSLVDVVKLRAEVRGQNVRRNAGA